MVFQMCFVSLVGRGIVLFELNFGFDFQDFIKLVLMVYICIFDIQEEEVGKLEGEGYLQLYKEFEVVWVK